MVATTLHLLLAWMAAKGIPLRTHSPGMKNDLTTTPRRVSFSERAEVASQRELYQKLLEGHRRQTRVTKLGTKTKDQAAA